MSNPARIEDIMRFLDNEETTTKVASAAPATAAPVAAPLQSALADVMSSIGQSKTASAAPVAAPVATPVNDLVKMANEVVAIDRDGEIKHAQLVGSAMADAFVARINQWDQAAASIDKTATQDETAQLNKFAAENPDAYRQAVSQGYADAKALIEKVGQDLYSRSFEAERERIEKVAAEHFVHGWNAIAAADRALAAQQSK